MCSLWPGIGEGAGHDVAQSGCVCMGEMQKEHNVCKQ